ncbi:hypothetical protein MXB_2281, partial [Myxobolus squamalis]
ILESLLNKSIIETQKCAEKITKEADQKVKSLYENQTQINVAVKQYLKAIERTEKSIEQWTVLFDEVNNKFKELGDIVNWSNVIQEDVCKIVETIKKSKN